MYYISRQVGRNKWGVIDTEDGHEDQMTRSELYEAVAVLGINIVGVELRERDIPGKYYIHNINVYQPSNTATRQQVRARVLQGVDFKMRNGTITGLSFAPIPGQDLVVRLSDYGLRLGDYILNWEFGQDLSRVRLIIDNKLSFSSKTFKDWTASNVVLDIRELTNRRKVDMLIDELSNSAGLRAIGHIETCLLDRPERAGYAECICLLNNGLEPDYMGTGPRWETVHDAVRDSDIGCKLIDSRYGHEFASLADVKLTMKAGIGYKRILHAAEFATSVPLSSINDFNVMWNYCQLVLLDYLFRLTTVNTKLLNRFRCYLTYFPVSYDAKEAYVKLCKRAGQFFIDVWKA